jgi:hypothetical protein
MTVAEGRPVSMRVVRLRAPGGPGQLAVEEAGRPRPGPGEAFVRVRAAAITRDELQWPVDRLPPIPSATSSRRSRGSPKPAGCRPVVAPSRSPTSKTACAAEVVLPEHGAVSATCRFMKVETVFPASWSTTELSGLGGPPGFMITHELARLTMHGFYSSTTWPPRAYQPDGDDDVRRRSGRSRRTNALPQVIRRSAARRVGPWRAVGERAFGSRSTRRTANLAGCRRAAPPRSGRPVRVRAERPESPL